MTDLHPTLLQTQPNVFKDTTGEFPQPLKPEEAMMLSNVRKQADATTSFKRWVLVLTALSIALGAIKLNFFTY